MGQAFSSHLYVSNTKSGTSTPSTAALPTSSTASEAAHLLIVITLDDNRDSVPRLNYLRLLELGTTLSLRLLLVVRSAKAAQVTAVCCMATAGK